VNKRWVIATPDPAATETLTRKLRISKPFASVLVNRGICDVDAAQRFLNPQLRQLADPLALPDMKLAVERILTAIEKKHQIIIYGDYDVDGVTSSALLFQVLRAAGARVENFLPHRVDEGYGLTTEGLTRCLKEHKPELLIAVDCGTSSCDEIADLTKRGVDTIVLDHHEPPAELPECVALVNPKCAAGGEPLASVGVSFKLAHGLLKQERRLADKIDLREHLDLVAIGTVADIVPLVGENRIFVRAGLKRLPQTKKIGLQALMDVADVPDNVKPYHIGFRIGPRLNAAGRLADATAALELLLTNDAERATQLAKLLNDHNAERQRVEERMTEEARTMAREFGDDSILVLSNSDWHAGVIGIVASRITQQFYRPTVIIGKDGKGSCRSISGFSIVDALTKCASVLERFGGHEMAAGLSIETGKIDELRRQLNEYAAHVLKDEDFRPRVRIDAVVRLDELDAEFFEQLERLEPCGQDNLEPTFVTLGLQLRGVPRVVGKDHLKFVVTDGETNAEAIWWKMAERELPSGPMDMAFNAELHEYRGARTVQLKVRDIRAAAP
jgi:single-stranded-DNA-specific exonuclease